MSKPQLSKCRNYTPKSCTGDGEIRPIRNVCENISNSCKWDVESEECLFLEDSDSCQSESYLLNYHSCQNIDQYCQWTNTTKVFQDVFEAMNDLTSFDFDDFDSSKYLDSFSMNPVPYDLSFQNNTCAPYEMNITACQDKRNKYGCRNSPIPCAWESGCINFDNFSHNCANGVSYLGCKYNFFSCVWDDDRCDWFDPKKHTCSQAINEITCLKAEELNCVWIDEIDDASYCTQGVKYNHQLEFQQLWQEIEANKTQIEKEIQE